MPDELPPMCCIGRRDEDWTLFVVYGRSVSKCNRRASVYYRGGGNYCHKHDPERLQHILDEQKEFTIPLKSIPLKSIPTDTLLRELTRRGVR